MWNLALWPGIKSGPPVLGGWSLNHWTTREVPLDLVKRLIPSMRLMLVEISNSEFGRRGRSTWEGGPFTEMVGISLSSFAEPTFIFLLWKIMIVIDSLLSLVKSPFYIFKMVFFAVQKLLSLVRSHLCIFVYRFLFVFSLTFVVFTLFVCLVTKSCLTVLWPHGL